MSMASWKNLKSSESEYPFWVGIPTKYIVFKGTIPNINSEKFKQFEGVYNL